MRADLALRCFAAFLVETAPGVTSTAQLTRRHVEDYKSWLAKRPGQNKARLTTATLAHRLGTLRMFFVRIDEWGWAEAPARVPMFPGELPRQDDPLPKALDDAAAAKLLRAAQADKRFLVRVTVEVLMRTGLRVSEFTGLRSDAVVHIGAGPWLHVSPGKLREDRYLPLHPQLVELIDHYRIAHVPAEHPLLLPRENGRALDRHTVTRFINKAGAEPGSPNPPPPAPAHPGHPGDQPRHVARGHRRDARPPQHGHDPALRQDRQPHRRRRVLRRYRQGRRPLRTSPGTARRRHRTKDGQAPSRAPPTPRQRLLHQTTQARLRLRVDLRSSQVQAVGSAAPLHVRSITRARPSGRLDEPRQD